MTTKAFLFVNGRDAGWRSYPLPAHGFVTIGSDPGVQVRLEEASVSPVHARLEIDETGLRICDLQSRNGTFVGGQLLYGRGVAVAPGQPILLGNSVLVVRCSAELRPVRPAIAPRRLPGHAMTSVADLVTEIAPTALDVLLLAERGVDRGVIADHIHRASSRAAGPWLALDCEGLAAPALERALFGHGGDASGRPGVLEAAAGGTVFLDNIGAMTRETQATLVLALEHQLVRRIEGTRARPIDVRLICATHHDLAAECRQARFRGDLYARLNGITIRIPPLRHRLDELDGSVAELARAAVEDGAPVPRFAPEALAMLRAYPWPGNHRELRDVVTRAVPWAEDGWVTVRSLRAAGLRDREDPREPAPVLRLVAEAT